MASMKMSGRAGCIVVALLASGGEASAQSKYPDGTGDVRRVANFYASVSEADHAACHPILLSLNNEYRLSDDKLDSNPPLPLASDALLASDLQVRWMRKLVDQPDGESFHVTSLDLVQAKSGKRTITLFRRGIQKKYSPETGALSVDRLWLSDTMPPSLPSDRRLTRDEVASAIKGGEILIDLTEPAKPDFMTSISSGTSFPSTLLNVVALKGELYVLAIDAAQAEIYAPKSTSGTVDLFVLRLLPDNRLRIVCRFRST